MANISGDEAVTIINNMLTNRITNQNNWGTNNMPTYSNPGWFAGTNREPGPVYRNQDSVFNGVINADLVMDRIQQHMAALARCSRKRIMIYYQSNGTPPTPNANDHTARTELITDLTAIGHFAWPVGGVSDRVATIPKGQPVTQAHLTSYCEAAYQRWWQLAGGPVTGTLTNTVCHSNCHDNCHGNRGRR